MELRPLLAVIMVIAACGPGGAGTGAPPGTQAPAIAATAPPTPGPVLEVPSERATLRTFAIAPKDTDAALAATAASHFVALDPAVPSRGQLFVFLGGLIVLPADTALIVRQAAANGFHAIALDYARELNVPRLCEKDADETCYEKVRLEVFDGEDRTPLASVTRANGTFSRLSKLLAHLAATYPSDGWSAFLADGAPRWSAIRLGGQSEGGAHVAMMARDRVVARVCLLESPVDLITSADGQRRLAPWIKPGATPADRYYGFRHLRSSSPLAPAFPLAWTALGLDRFGAAVSVDGVRAPYGGSHHLTTDLEPVGDGGPNISHRSVVQDRVTPKTTEGRPAFAPVWQYACLS